MLRNNLRINFSFIPSRWIGGMNDKGIISLDYLLNQYRHAQVAVVYIGFAGAEIGPLIPF